LVEIDRWVYEYFCLSDDEIVLIEDTLDSIIPAIQPNQGSYPDLWKAPSEQERRDYATTLMRSVDGWLANATYLNAGLEAQNSDLGVLRLTINGPDKREEYSEDREIRVDDVLSSRLIQSDCRV